MDKKTKSEILHVMRNIAQKFKLIEHLQATQKHTIESVNRDWDKVWDILDERNIER